MSTTITEVVSSDGSMIGRLTGGARSCGMEGCCGLRLATRWPDGKLTYPCTEGLHSRDGRFVITSKTNPTQYQRKP